MPDGVKATEIKISDTKTYVKIKYRVRVANGPVLKGAEQPEVMDFVTGFGHVIPGLEGRLISHGVGEKLSFTVPPEEAFGVRRDELMIEKDKKDFHFPPGVEPFPGMEIPMVTSAHGAPDTVMIREVNADSIVIDCNHPLSGAPLQYDLEIVEVRPARDTDMCPEWEEKTVEGACAGSPHEIVLGKPADWNRLENAASAPWLREHPCLFRAPRTMEVLGSIQHSVASPRKGPRCLDNRRK